jgi:gas vesicle protein GvpN
VTTVLRASPRQFVSTPAIERVAMRALRYLQSGFSVHLRGPAGTGKTTLALHLADLLTRPMMLIFGDDEFKTSDLIGNQSGYTRKKVVDNYIHTVMKVEDEVRQNWVDSRLTLACREGFTLVYDEFNRSRPEVNNVLLSALEEKLLVLPPSSNQMEYIRVNPNFRAIFTSNPEEYCGVHATQDALLDRLITINIPEPDELTQQEILVHKTAIDRPSAVFIVRLVQAFRHQCSQEKTSGLRACLTLAKVAQEHALAVSAENAEFRDMCADILLSRSNLPTAAATQILWQLLNDLIVSQPHPTFVNAPEAITNFSLASLTVSTAASTTDHQALDTVIPGVEEPITELPLNSFSTHVEASGADRWHDPVTAKVAADPARTPLMAADPARATLTATITAPLTDRFDAALTEADRPMAPLAIDRATPITDLASETLPESVAAARTLGTFTTEVDETITNLSLDTFTTNFAETGASDCTVSATWPETTETEELVELCKDLPESSSAAEEAAHADRRAPYTEEVLAYLLTANGMSLTTIETALGLTRLQVVDAVRTLIKQDLVIQRDRRFFAQEPEGVGQL